MDFTEVKISFIVLITLASGYGFSHAYGSECKNFYSPSKVEYLKKTRKYLVQVSGFKATGIAVWNSRNANKADRMVSLSTEHLLTLEPDDGLGRILIFQKKKDFSFGENLWPSVLRNPAAYRKLGIYADEKYLVMPDAARLNALIHILASRTNLNTKIPITINDFVQYESIEFQAEQYYSELAFYQSFRQGKVLIASRGEEMAHDRLQEHLLGGILVHPISMHRLNKLTELLQKIAEHPVVKNDSTLLDHIITAHIEGISIEWDSWTKYLGLAGFDILPSHESVRPDTRYLIEAMYKMDERIVEKIEAALSIAKVDYLTRNLSNTDRKKLTAYLNELAIEYEKYTSETKDKVWKKYLPSMKLAEDYARHAIEMITSD